MRFSTIAMTAVMLAVPVAASAHDFWLLPTAFHIDAPGDVGIAIRIGDEAKPEPWKLRWDKVVALRSFGPRGVVDQQARIVPTTDAAPGGATVALAEPGTHLLAFESYQSFSDLVPAKFNPYLAHEGLALVIADRIAKGTTGKNGRESYSRRAKALIQVGDTLNDDILRPVGHTLEIVPEKHPFALGADRKLPVVVLFRGKPLVGAQVSQLDLYGDGKPVADVITDSAGRAVFTVPERSSWRLNVVWSVPDPGNPKVEYDTIFTSLTFGYRQR